MQLRLPFKEPRGCSNDCLSLEEVFAASIRKRDEEGGPSLNILRRFEKIYNEFKKGGLKKVLLFMRSILRSVWKYCFASLSLSAWQSNATRRATVACDPARTEGTLVGRTVDHAGNVY